jgi:hypothetical protein
MRSLANPRNFGDRVIELAVRAKVTPITAHCLRDTHASLLAKKGVPLEVVSKRLGHADIRITADATYTSTEKAMQPRRGRSIPFRPSTRCARSGLRTPGPSTSLAPLRMTRDNSVANRELVRRKRL